jgi:hypothetical protein
LDFFKLNGRKSLLQELQLAIIGDMFRKILASTIVLLFAVSTANAGVIVCEADSPTVSSGGMRPDSGNQDNAPSVPVLKKHVDNQMQAIDFDRPASVCPAVVVEIPRFVFYVSLQGNILVGNSNLPSPPDLDGLLKPPQKSNEQIV